MAMTGKKKLFSNARFVLIGIAIGLALGVGGVMFLQSHNPEDEEKVDQASIVFERIVAQNELVSVSQKYNIVDKATNDSIKLFDSIDIPVNSSFWYRYAGTIKAGVDMGEAAYRRTGQTIYVKLGEPYLISNTPDMEKSGVLEENSNVFNPIHVEDVDTFQAQCFQRSQEEAVTGGLLEEARENAKNDVRNMLIAALGDEYTVEFE